MNILIPHSWLKQFLTTQASPKKIADCLSLCGPSVEKIDQVNSDSVYDIEVTTNRVDMMSVNGIAREAAAILPQFGLTAKLKQDIYRTSPVKLPSNLPSFPLKVSLDHHLCQRFTAVVIKNVTLKPSPKKISQFLEHSGIRSLNNVVDISNYLMRAYGQPVHTFDFDKIKQTMILRASKPGETLTTLDGQFHTLPGNDIVIQDGDHRLIDLCGIMGGLNTAVDQNTTNVLLFVQTYSPSHIRQTSMKLAHRSEAAQLFEKTLDSELVMPVLIQGIQLFKQLTGGQPASQIIDLYPKKYQPNSVKLPLQLIKDRLGVEITSPEVTQILTSLGFQPQTSKTDLTVQVPSWRANDVSIPEDIVEEVARIYGYHRLPSQLMATPIPTHYPDDNFHLEHQIKTWLADLGLYELYTNSMISQELAHQSTLPLRQHLKIKNALSQDWLYLRRSLLPSHLQAIQENPQQKSVSFFEIAHTYHPRPHRLPEEKLQLIIITTKTYPYLKGTVGALLQKLHLTDKTSFQPSQTPDKPWLKSQTADIFIKQKKLGHLGTVKLPPSYPFKQVSAALLDVQPLIKLARSYPQYQPLSGFPPIIEDMTFTLPDKTYLEPVIDTIKSIHKLIHQVKLVKQYRQNYTFNITYLSYHQALTDQTIAPLRKKILQKLKQKFQAKLVGKL